METLWWGCFTLKGLSYRVPILGASSNPQSNLCLVRGGISGTYFVLAAQDCNQPRAGRGVMTLGSDDLPIRTIRYKTLGVLDRQCVVGFQRWDKASGTYSQVMSWAYASRWDKDSIDLHQKKGRLRQRCQQLRKACRPLCFHLALS